MYSILIDTVAEVTVLGTEVYNRIRKKPSVSMPTTIMLAGDCALLKGSIL